MQGITTYQKIYYTLRVTMAMCFIGHGAFGIITKQIWCNYFAVFDIGNNLAYQLMPPLGAVDIIMGLIILFYPIRAIVLWLFIWGLVTALLRPLSGEHVAEVFERAGNYGAPLVMLLLTGSKINPFKELLTPVALSVVPDQKTKQVLSVSLRLIVFMLLAGHGWLNLIEKNALIQQYASLGFSDPAQIAHYAGIFEITAAFVLLMRPFGYLLLVVLVWKLSTELLHQHYALFEWIERGGSYGCILALWFLVTSKNVLFPRIPKINLSISGY